MRCSDKRKVEQMTYKKKGFNKKSLTNLNKGRTDRYKYSNRCISCKNQKSLRTNFCLEHLVRRMYQDLTEHDYNLLQQTLVTKFKGRGFEGRIIK
jgi:hypothetical protein